MASAPGAHIARSGRNLRADVPIGRAQPHLSGDVRCVRSVRGGRSRIGRYGRAPLKPSRVSDGARIAGSVRAAEQEAGVVLYPSGPGDPRLPGDATHDPTGGMTVESLTGPVHEDRALKTLADREVESPGNPRREWHGHDLAALAGHRQGPMTSLEAERVDTRTKGFGDAQPIQRQ
jgi:hypothetical protein